MRYRNRSRRHPLRRLLGKALVFAFLVVLVVLAITMHFRISGIFVEGNRQYEDSEVIAASGIKIGDNMFFVSKKTVSDRLFRELPYISNVSVRHDWPFSIVLKVEESVSAALMQTEDGYCVLNNSGKVMDVFDAVPETLSVTEIKGITGKSPTLGKILAVSDGEDEAFAELLALLSALARRNLLEEVGSIELTTDNCTELTYLDRFTVRIPFGADYDYKIKFLLSVIENLEDNEKGLIDMTYPDGEVHFLAS